MPVVRRYSWLLPAGGIICDRWRIRISSRVLRGAAASRLKRWIAINMSSGASRRRGGDQSSWHPARKLKQPSFELITPLIPSAFERKGLARRHCAHAPVF